jgi:N-acetylglucosamine kinase-like BadF-type ATPase
MKSWLLIEGGGTKTWVCVTGREPVIVTGGSTHAGSVGDNDAARLLTELISKAISSVPPSELQIDLVVAAHGAATTLDSAANFAATLSSSLTQLGLHPPMVITGDILPILLVAGQEISLAAIVGTGSEYAGTYRFEKFSHAGGMDYILSDEGGGYDIGLHGLRAVVRALDGRSAPTSLSVMAAQWLGGEPSCGLASALFNKLRFSAPRSTVASFAPSVVSCAKDGDAVAESILNTAAGEIVAGLIAVRSSLPQAAGSEGVALSGSLVTTDNVFREIVLRRIRAELPSLVVSLAGAERFVEQITRLGQFILDHRNDLDILRAVGPIILHDETRP